MDKTFSVNVKRQTAALNYEISTMWGTKPTTTTPQETAGLLVRPEQDTRPKTLQAILLLLCIRNAHLREKRRLRVVENKVLRRIFGPRKDEVKGEWRKLHNEELNDLYASPNIVRVIKSRRMRWAGHVAPMGERRGVYRFLVGKHKGNRPLGRPRRRW